MKAQCATGPAWDGKEFSHLCYNDLQFLYEARGLDSDHFPYIGGRLEGEDLVGDAIEYPVLTGLFMWASALLVEDPKSYLHLSFLLLAPFGLLTAYLLAQMTGRRALMWAAAPALIWYSFHNWDLLVVAAATAGIWAWWRGSDVGAAILFGIGGATKLYPAFFLAPLILYVGGRWGWRRAAQVAACGAGTLIAINLPFAVVDFDGWIATYGFHSLRAANLDSIWALGFPTMDVIPLNLITGGLTAGAFVVALVVGWARSRSDEVYPFLPVVGALMCAFLLFGKIQSPQYTLWLLPFFALVQVNVLWWVAYSLVDLVVYVGVFRWFYDATRWIYDDSLQPVDFSFFKGMMIAGVWGRALLLIFLYIVFLKARSALRGPPADSRVGQPIRASREAIGADAPI